MPKSAKSSSSLEIKKTFTFEPILTLNKIKIKSIKHKKAYTAQEIAASAFVPGKQVIKSVLIKTDKDFILAVLPAIHLVDFKALKNVLKSRSKAPGFFLELQLKKKRKAYIALFPLFKR